MAIDPKSLQELETEHRAYGDEIVKHKFFPALEARDIEKRGALRDKVENIDPVQATGQLYKNNKGAMVTSDEKSGFWTAFTMQFAQWGAFSNTRVVTEEDETRARHNLTLTP